VRSNKVLKTNDSSLTTVKDSLFNLNNIFIIYMHTRFFLFYINCKFEYMFSMHISVLLLLLLLLLLL
jgi:hypothetical protein